MKILFLSNSIGIAIDLHLIFWVGSKKFVEIKTRQRKLKNYLIVHEIEETGLTKMKHQVHDIE